MTDYHVVNADFIEVVNTKQADLSMLPTETRCGSSFVEVEKHSTDKSPEGSSMRTMKGITVRAYSSVCGLIKPSVLMRIHNVDYGNLEYEPIPNSRTKVIIRGWA